MNYIEPCANSIFDIHNPLEIKLLTSLRLGLTHLHKHKFRHCFQDTLNPLCECAKILNQQCISFSTAPTFSFIDEPSFRKLETLMIAFYLKANRNELKLCYGNYHSSVNRLTIISTIEYLISTKRFKCSLLWKRPDPKLVWADRYYICVILFFLLLRYVN